MCMLNNTYKWKILVLNNQNTSRKSSCLKLVTKTFKVLINFCYI